MRRSPVAASATIVGAALIALTGCGPADSTGAAPSASGTSATGTSATGTSATGAPAAEAQPTPGAEAPEPGSLPDMAAPDKPGPAVPGVPALTGDPTDLTRASQAQPGTGQPPTTLLTQDIVVGNGARATPDDRTVQIRYTGTLYAGGKVFDSSWSRGNRPVDFPVDAVVPGFAQGITGMRQGGRRVIVIPPALGYGPDNDGPIPGNSTLVFVVDLIGVT